MLYSPSLAPIPLFVDEDPCVEMISVALNFKTQYFVPYDDEAATLILFAYMQIFNLIFNFTVP